jgi:hypothetical protein
MLCWDYCGAAGMSLCGDGANAIWAEQLREGDKRVDGGYEEFAHGVNATRIVSTCETAPHRRIPSCCAFATHRLCHVLHLVGVVTTRRRRRQRPAFLHIE